MVRFGRGFPVPRQNLLLPSVSDEINQTINITSGFRVAGAIGTLDVFTSEEVVVAILGVGGSASAGQAGVGIIEGGISQTVNLTGVGAVGRPGSIVALADDFSPWKKPRPPRWRWKKPQDFADTEFDGGVEFVPQLANLSQYGQWWFVSNVTSDRILLRHPETISSDYSLEGRP